MAGYAPGIWQGSTTSETTWSSGDPVAWQTVAKVAPEGWTPTWTGTTKIKLDTDASYRFAIWHKSILRAVHEFDFYNVTGSAFIGPKHFETDLDTQLGWPCWASGNEEIELRHYDATSGSGTTYYPDATFLLIRRMV